MKGASQPLHSLLWCASRSDKLKLLQNSCARDVQLCRCQALIPFLFLLIARVISSTMH